MYLLICLKPLIIVNFKFLDEVQKNYLGMVMFSDRENNVELCNFLILFTFQNFKQNKIEKVPINHTHIMIFDLILERENVLA